MKFQNEYPDKLHGHFGRRGPANQTVHFRIPPADNEKIALRISLFKQTAGRFFETYLETRNEQFLLPAIDPLKSGLTENLDFQQGWLNVRNFFRLQQDMENAKWYYQRPLDIDPKIPLQQTIWINYPGDDRLGRGYWITHQEVYNGNNKNGVDLSTWHDRTCRYGNH